MNSDEKDRGITGSEECSVAADTQVVSRGNSETCIRTLSMSINTHPTSAADSAGRFD